MKTKICSKCKEKKPITEFYERKCGQKGLRYLCKECTKKYNRTVARKRMNWFQEIKKTLKCENCQESRWWLLEFHHTNSDEKEFTIGACQLSNKEKILKEIKKCQVLCANCHRDLHYKLKLKEQENR